MSNFNLLALSSNAPWKLLARKDKTIDITRAQNMANSFLIRYYTYRPYIGLDMKTPKDFLKSKDIKFNLKV